MLVLQDVLEIDPTSKDFVVDNVRNSPNPLPWWGHKVKIQNTKTGTAFSVFIDVCYYPCLDGYFRIDDNDNNTICYMPFSKEDHDLACDLRESVIGQGVDPRLLLKITAKESYCTPSSLTFWVKASKEWEHLLRREQGLEGYSRGLEGYYLDGYNYELCMNIMDVIQHRLKTQKKVRFLDVGCGNCQAVKDIEDRAEWGNVSDKVYALGIGIHRFENQKTHSFKQIPLLDFCVAPRERFDLITSLSCFLYMPDKLRAIEHIYNSLLANNGLAKIQVPSSLIQFLGGPSNRDVFGAWNNDFFRRFLKTSTPTIDIKYIMHPEHESGYFGLLVMRKKPNTELHFPTELAMVGRAHENGSLTSLYRILHP